VEISWEQIVQEAIVMNGGFPRQKIFFSDESIIQTDYAQKMGRTYFRWAFLKDDFSVDCLKAHFAV